MRFTHLCRPLALSVHRWSAVESCILCSNGAIWFLRWKRCFGFRTHTHRKITRKDWLGQLSCYEMIATSKYAYSTMCALNQGPEIKKIRWITRNHLCRFERVSSHCKKGCKSQTNNVIKKSKLTNYQIYVQNQENTLDRVMRWVWCEARGNDTTALHPSACQVTPNWANKLIKM